MLGAFKARVAPFNVNYRYVAEELRYLLRDSQATAIVVHSQFAPTLAECCPSCPQLRVILQVPTTRVTSCCRAPSWYEDALAAASPASRRSSGAPTTSTSSTPAARPGCRRA